MPSSCSSFAVAQARMQGVCVQDVEGDEGYLIHTEALFTACTRDSRHILPRFEAMPALNQCLAFEWEKHLSACRVQRVCFVSEAKEVQRRRWGEWFCAESSKGT
mmetsp:Transcript_33367/g.73243  ORF Transcript_33367/g.73243 Transcript_33367/m.73243 type:complete len:104 (-) Transcript_33367:242-553(-)